MSFKARIAAGAIGVLAIGGTALVTAAPSSATTLTCTNVNNATFSPFGCGGLQSPSGTLAMYVDTFGSTLNNDTYDNAVVRVEPPSVTSPNEDFTAFAVCDGATFFNEGGQPVPTPTPTGESTAPPPVVLPSPAFEGDTCSVGDTTGSIGGLGKYVGMYTPLGNIPSFTIVNAPSTAPATGCAWSATGGVSGGPVYDNAVPCEGIEFEAGPNTFCLSIASENNGPKHAARWNVVMRPCDTNGVFVYGSDINPGFVSNTHGNAWQEWAPVDGEFGLDLVNVWINIHRSNDEYTLNITGNGGAGTHLIAYPLYGPSMNESWIGIGCTPPLSSLVNANEIPKSYALCP